MFTGIITDVGEVADINGGQFTLRSGYEAASIPLGASIGCDGCCLTATSVAPAGSGLPIYRGCVQRDQSKTTLGAWQVGTRVNLERALRAGDELGGHIVSGHIDAVASIVDITPDGDSRRFTFEAPEHLALYIAPKGSVALDGISLTVNEVAGSRFGNNVIPHTLRSRFLERQKPATRSSSRWSSLTRYVRTAV